MISRVLASLSQTPRFEKGMRAFDVQYRSPDAKDKRAVVLTRGNAEVGQQIRQTLFSAHPETIDYTFSEFDYIDFQARSIVWRGLEMVMSRETMGENFIDLAEL